MKNGLLTMLGICYTTLQLCAQHASDAQTKQYQSFGNIEYRVPEGWLSYQSGNRIDVYPARPKPEEKIQIMMLPGKAANKSMQDELAATWEEVRAYFNAELMTEVTGGNYNVGEPGQSGQGWTYLAAEGAIKTGYDQLFVHPYIIQVNDRYERVVVVAQQIRLNLSNIDPFIHHPPFYKAVTEFVFGLQFKNWTTAPKPRASWKGNGIAGVWEGIGMRTGWDGAKLKTTYLIFFNNGQAYYGSAFPGLGLHDFDTYLAKTNNPRDWGTYTFQNGIGTIKLSHSEIPIRLEGDKLAVKPISETHRYIRLPRIDSLVLDGTYEMEDWEGRKVSITFRKDGTFEDRGALTELDHVRYIYYYSVADGGGSGKYSIKDYSILFNYSDGRTFQIAFPGLGYNGEISPAQLALSFNQDVLKKSEQPK